MKKRLVMMALGVVLLACSGVLDWRTTVRSQEDSAWVAHTYQVIAALREVRVDLKQMESSRRGYALTADPTFLTSFAQADERLAGALQDVGRLTVDNSGQQSRLNVLTPAVAERVDQLHQALHAPAGEASPWTEKGAVTGQRVEVDLQGLEDAEQALLVERAARAGLSSVRSLTTVVLADVFGLLLMGGAFWLVWRYAGEIRRSERERRRANDFLDAVVENIPSMICVREAEGLRVVRTNRAGAALLDEGEKAEDRAAVESGQPVDIPEEVIGDRVLHTRKVPLQVEGSGRFLLSISDDITERKKTEKMKEELLALTTHELRSPLTSINGALQLLVGMASGVPEQFKKMADIAWRNAQRMARLVDDFLYVEKLDSGAMAFDIQKFPVGPFLNEAVELNGPYGERLEVRFVIAQPGPEGAVSADRDRLLQVVTNLMTNAAKFSPKGAEVVVSATRVEGGLRLAVTDTGSGIPEAHRSKIFQRFGQVPGHRAGGTGLGLNIARSMIEKMGGTIGFDTTEGKGTTFWVILPLA
ncbi:MAG TPA: ATP-binding protein [Candidatus Xenobia bacterium]|jgi:signal transduction histidine kinase